MAKEISNLSNAIVFSLEKEELYILSVEKIHDFTPKHTQDFQKHHAYVTLERGRVLDEFEVIELASYTEAKKRLKVLQDAVLSHALVFCLIEKNFTVIPVSSIRQFSKSEPKYKDNYIPEAEYNIKTNSEKFDVAARIYGFGDAMEMELLLSTVKDISHAFAYFMNKDTLQTISIENIKEFQDVKPRNKKDFVLLNRYEGRLSDEEDYQYIQILALGDFVECATLIDTYNRITHAFVLFKRTKLEQIIQVTNIKEFRSNIPERLSDVDLSKLYSGRVSSGTNYSAVQLVNLGHESILEFLNIYAPKRVIKRKFNDSDLSFFDQQATSGESDSTNDERQETTFDDRQTQTNDPKNKSSKKGQKDFEERRNILLDNDNEVLNARMRLETANNVNKTPNRNSSTDESGSHRSHRRVHRQAFDRNSNISSDENDPPNRQVERSQRMRKKMRKDKERSARSSECRKKLAKTDEEIFYALSTDDSSTGSTTDFAMFARIKEKDSETGDFVEMIHLGRGHKITYSDWKHEIKYKSRDDQAFVKNFTRVFYGKSILEKCLQIKPYMMVVVGKSRSVIPADEIDVLKRCLKYWVYTKATHILRERKIKEILSNVPHIISEEINHQFKEFKRRGGKTDYIAFTANKPTV